MQHALGQAVPRKRLAYKRSTAHWGSGDRRKLIGWERARRPEERMLPLVLCRAYSQQDLIDASAVAGLAAVFGWLTARQAKLLWIWISCLVGLLLPTAALLGFWPFDPSWKDDCGATPDPAMLTMGAAMAFPLLLGAAYLASRWLNQPRRRKPPG